MAVKKFLLNLQIEITKRIAELSGTSSLGLVGDILKKRQVIDPVLNAIWNKPQIRQLQSILDDDHFWELSATEPQGPKKCIAYCIDKRESNWSDARFYHFKNSVYAVKGEYTEEQDRLLIEEAFDMERQKFERLKRKFSEGDSREAINLRQQIPEDVRIAVWRRDGGACARCESRERLEYDHIIPVSRGGSNTVRNIELLCEVCNRSKSNHIQ